MKLRFYNSWLEETFDTESQVTIVDILSHGRPENPQFMLPEYYYDGIHPNAAGHHRIAEVVDLSISNYFNVKVRCFQ